MSHFDKRGGWRSRQWLQFIRQLECQCMDTRCPNCTVSPYRNRSHVIAAHLRNKDGLGVKPDDFMAYPLSDTIHRIWHDHGQPSIEMQLRLLQQALRAGFRSGVLSVGEPDEGDFPF